MTTAEALTERIIATGETIRTLKASKGDKDALTQAIAELLALKTQFKELTGADYGPPPVEKKKEKTPKEVVTDAGGGEGAKKSKKELNKEKKKAAKAAIKLGEATSPAKPVGTGVATTPAPAVVMGPVGRLLPVPTEGQDGLISFSSEKLPLVSYMVAILSKQDPSKLFQSVSGPAIAPTLVFATGEVISGDVAIARYLCRTYGMPLYGGHDANSSSTPVIASQIDAWIDFASSRFGNADSTAEALAFLDLSLQDRTYFIGYAITLADLTVWSTLHTFVQPDAWCNLTNVTRWWLHLESQPSFHTATSSLQALVSTTSTSRNDRNASHKGKDSGSCPPLKGAIDGQVVTRFPPEPSGFLHIGHLKACLLNDYYARHYHGQLILRFDDTNPSKEKDAFEQSIIADLKRLAIVPDKVTYTSDWFPDLANYARQLITQGDAYMDNTPQDQMRDERMNGIESQCRNQSIEVNLRLFEQLITNHPDATGYCLRGKIDMQAKNKTLRDPVFFRANNTPHHRTGTKYCAYPTYDLACPIVDSLEGVTHALRTTEYNDRDEQYQWVLTTLNLRKVCIHGFARMNFVYSVLSKRKLQWFVDNGYVEGWNDPRFPTIQGVLRRGVQAEALREFIVSQGASRRITDMEWDKFWTLNKRVIDPIAYRYFALDQEQAVPLKLTNVSDGVTAIPVLRHPKNTEMGNKMMRFSNQLLIEYDDAVLFKEGEEVTLMRHGNIIIQKIYKHPETNKVIKIDALNHPQGDFKKTKLKITWLADVNDLVPCTLVEFDHLMSKAKLEENDQFQDHLTKVTRAEMKALGDHELRNAQVNEIVQLERRGFFRVDAPYISKEKPLVLFMVPDGKVKAMSTLSTKLTHR